MLWSVWMNNATNFGKDTWHFPSKRALPMASPPILYTFRRCPYAIRARMALAHAGIVYQVREVLLRNKPVQLLNISPKATVPVLLLSNGTVIDESLDILSWALDQNDAQGWRKFERTDLKLIMALIDRNDREFKMFLDRYKYADRYPKHPRVFYREQAEKFLKELEERLKISSYFFGSHISCADVAIFPFVRQFSKVDQLWFEESSYSRLKVWLAEFSESELFGSVMKKYIAWKESDSPILSGKPTK